ncbi:MAG: 10 kDa chaperonin [Methanomicrobiales archaeon 53_19]|jgi:chaperonin GroES|uniref:co-chaperone GroES n=1 Tax=Methanocalculus sp. TaxID=2004547 RepID=UPI000748B5D2|nr:co-chaperone GroES [Methanocalculus sp.]KUK70791.1 MAG: 10 kDa chaperonin [Methanocalculus sp. 52_23]KUL04602.1 MAG: 10 kDa chaperonin [Methanomicrobiales archaeon 53_19]HIJ06823.1 co-chaperone GroES [Methanocalculus sp.]
MAIIPIGERVLIRPIQPEEKTKSGIYIPDSAREKRKEGDVIACGTYKDGKELPVQAGDRILYGGYSSEKINVDNEELVMIEFKDVIAKVE